MRAPIRLVLLPLLAACASMRPVARGLYSAVVQRSNAPPRDELRRIRARDSTMVRGLARARVLVLPVAVIGRGVRADSLAAARLAGRLVRDGLAASVRVGAPVPVPFEPHPNEALVFWTRFRALAAAVRADPPADADVVLLVDVFGRPEAGIVGAVHAMATTGAGEMAWHGFWNSHHALYREARPASVDAAAGMVATALARRVR